MSSTLIQCLFFVVWFIHLDADVYRDRPRIKTNNGHLILEPAYGKNVYLQTNGPQSTVFVGNYNILNVNITDNGQQSQPSNIDLDGILRRLERLEHQRNVQPTDGFFNTTMLWRKVNRLTTRVTNLQALIDNIVRDQCQSRPCRHGGTCLNLANGYHCLCPSNWEGKDCDEDVNECIIYQGTKLGCQNSRCKNTPGSYECECNQGWYGQHCTRRNKDCSGGNFEMCGHGTCIQTTTGQGITCICEQGWTNNQTDAPCLIDINECESSQGPRCSVNPKVECINLPGSFRCGQCPPGYEGDGYTCYDIDECLSISNGGCSTSPLVTCHNTVGSRICGPCPAGYQGDGVTCTWRGSCSINRGGCHPSAQCIDNSALGGQMAQCVCPPGMEGDGIGLHGCYVSTGNLTRGCDTNPCGIHGQCHLLRSGYTCICYRGYGGSHCDTTNDYCSNSPCLHGGTCRTDLSSLRGFRCECTAQYSGDLCQVAETTCGGYLHAEKGSIVYPLSNITYNHNARCAWVIHTESDKVINVTFSKFNLEYHPECLYDFLQIHDGRTSASQLIDRFCGNTPPKGGNIISSHNYLYLWFRSDRSVAKDGFALHWTSINPVCGGEVDAKVHGQISTPGSPGKYPPNRDCYWHLSTDLGKRIEVHFFSLDIEMHSNCSYDFVAIYDGEHTTDPLIGQFCNSTLPSPITSAGSYMLIYFHSDGYGSGYGFQAAFAPSPTPGCGGLYTAYKGEISSPSYDGKYLSNVICDYKIKVNPDNKIRLDFKSFHLERSAHCRYDFIKVYDGPSEDSPLVGKFCGTTYPKTYTSSSNEVFIMFKSDQSVSAEGFRINYETVCQKTVVGDSGFIKSPGYPFSYPENQVCEYVIATAPGKVIQLTFQDFDIEDSNHYDCMYDNVEIRDGENVNATLLGTYCGGSEHTPPTKLSTHNYMYLRFNSDLSNSGTGFYANFTTIDVECGGIYITNNETINHPSANEGTYSNNQHCIWIIKAPEGMRIKLTWNRFDVEEMMECSSDYVLLEELNENNEKDILGKYCGTALPPVIITSTNRLRIEFISDYSIRSIGFSVSYSFVDDKTCDGFYKKTHGFIYSPGWPKRYPSNRDCIWKITVPAGQQIVLNITQFNLERPIRQSCDNGDYLEIRNGPSEASSQLGKFCGNFQEKRIVSFSNSLYLHFHSDFYITGNGFKIEWDGTVTGCGGTLTSPFGSISSPNYPFNYNENAECFYSIVTNAGSILQITFKELELERTHNCRDDFIELFDGRDENSQSLGKYCHKSANLKTIESSTNHVYIKFRSDFYIGGKGFLLEYNTVCETNITGLYGVIESPGFPGSYPMNLNCLWTISVPKGNRINITFTDFDVSRAYWRGQLNYQRPWSFYPSPDGVRAITNSAGLSRFCAHDYIQMKDSTDVNFGDKLCGQKLPSRLSTAGNSIQIKFVTTPFYIAFHGFRLEWALFGCGGYIQKSFGSISVDSTLTSRGDLECEWIIETTLGMSLTINVNDLYMTNSKNCSTDALEFYNGPNTNTPLLSKICHRDTNSMTSVVSTTNFILIRFVKQSSLKDVQFSIYFSSYRSGCGGRIEALSGFIHSKNYPKNYENNMDCMWTLEVPKNHRIELNFMEFDLYSTSNDDEDCDDLIKIYEGEFVLNSNYTERLCPNSNVTLSRIVSKKNIMGVQFISDSFGTAKGFKANFSVTCGATITANFDGIIANEKWHTTHIENCTWIILAPSLDQKISLTITHLSIPKETNTITNRNCPSSFLRVLDGDDSTAPMVDEYCGRKVPPMIVSKGSALTLVFGAYNGTAQGQFAVHYSPMMSSCGGTLTSEEGSIASPNYPQSYPGNTSCEWILGTSPGNRVYITFEKFDLQSSENCNEDYLEVRENNGGGKLLGTYCGPTIPFNTTTASTLYLKFHSNSENSGKGFILHYGFVHGNEINGLKSGVIASPLYPNYYDSTGEYSWRISIEEGKVIVITIFQAEIPSQGSVCYNSLTFYDGYDEEAAVLEEFCGVLKTAKEITTSSNIAYIKLKLDESNTGSIFNFHWTNADVAEESTDVKPNCGSNGTEILLPGKRSIIQSPGYPDKYQENLNCEWVFKAEPGRHITLHFSKLELEEVPGCFSDYVSIYSSDSLPLWTLVKEKFCLWEDAKEDFNSSTFMKIVFKTDFSVSRKGFEAQVTSVCGGLIVGQSGTIEPLYQDFNFRYIRPKCDWTIKVRPGRTIKLHFEHFNITDTNDDCSTKVTIRNGHSVESPLLGNARYCGKVSESRSDLKSSSNVVFVSYIVGKIINMRTFTNFRLRFEEEGVECGFTSTLDIDHSWKVLNSPNYKSPPPAYSECIWLLRGPPGELLRIDFIDRFDLNQKTDCTSEVVEIRDGITDIAPLKGRYCGRISPNTVKTTSNAVYIKYLTQLSEPNNGFQANVSIDICGGTVQSSRGEVVSPGYPHLRAILYGSICEWKIVAPRAFTLLLQPRDIELPQSSSYCTSKITIEEKQPVDNTVTVLRTYCAEEDHDDDILSSIQTSSNEVTIKLHMGPPSDWSSPETKRGFRFTFNSSMPRCGGEITTPEGFITSPGYPRDTSLRYCHWLITVPNKSRRVRLELLDFNTEKQRIGIYNDLQYVTKVLYSSDSDVTSNVYESSQNTMAIYLLLDPVVTKHRFKAKFSSNEAALCGGVLSERSGELSSPDIDRSYTCTWQYKPKSSYNSTYQSLYTKIKVNSSLSNRHYYCHRSDSILSIKFGNMQSAMRKQLCGRYDTSLTIPANEIELTAYKNNNTSFFFHLEWNLNPCGGVVDANDNEMNILDVPNNYNNTLNCVWLVKVPTGTRVQVKLNGLFQLDCDNEFIKVGQGSNILDDVPALGDYCKDKVQDSPLILPYSNILVVYHSSTKHNTTVQLTVKIESDYCGGVLTDNTPNVFQSPHFPHYYEPNLECSWEINTYLGNRVSLQFIERFAIEEDKNNCSKDAVILYDWLDNSWVEKNRLCGRSLPAAFNSTLNRMRVVFRTDANKVTMDGFKAQWYPICGGEFYATNEIQYLYSPGNTYYGYLPDLDCTYKILGGENRILIRFLEFSLEGTYPSCNFDNLTILAEADYDFIQTTYCGSEIPMNLSEYNEVTLIFKTDRVIQRKGFKLSFQLYQCGGLIKQPSVIRSHSNSDEYGSNENCTWIIEAPKDKIVVINFQYIDLEVQDTCYADYVAVFNSNWINEDKRIGLMCGNINSPTTLRSTGNIMVVQFYSDNSVQRKGFVANIIFSYSSTVGCGGDIDLTSLSSSSTKSLNSPLINGSSVYENFLDCLWNIKAPTDYAIKIKFTQFHIAPCEGVNQTAIGYSVCDCDYVQIIDGVNPNDLVIGTFCGHNIPDGQELTSSANFMSVRLSTDGELSSAGFKAELTLQRQYCGQTFYTVAKNVQTIKSPGYTTGIISRGIHCVYHFDSSSNRYATLQITIKKLDLRPKTPNTNQCNNDKLLVISVPKIGNSSISSDFVINSRDFFFQSIHTLYQDDLKRPDRFELCGTKTNIDLYLSGSVSVHLITSPESDAMQYRGVELEVSYLGLCGRNFTDLQGRIASDHYGDFPGNISDCYTLITVPENYTISLYFLHVERFYVDDIYLDIFDGDKTYSPKLGRINADSHENQYFSSARHILLHHHFTYREYVLYDLNYVATDKGKGCGGKLHNLVGKVTSPLYPSTYRQRSTCEWELETPEKTHLFLRFTTFDLGRACDKNYVQLVDRSGRIFSTYCSESPADYTSADNYVKIVFTTTMNNGGTGWEAEFTAVL